MTWFDWLLVGIFALSPLIQISQIGQPRKPLGRSDAVIGTILSALLIWGVVVYA